MTFVTEANHLRFTPLVHAAEALDGDDFLVALDAALGKEASARLVVEGKRYNAERMARSALKLTYEVHVFRTHSFRIPIIWICRSVKPCG